MSVNEYSQLAAYKRISFYSKDGYEVEVDSSCWRLNKDVVFRFDGFPEYVDHDILNAFKQVLSIYGSTCSGHYTSGQFRRMKSYFQVTPFELLFSPASMISFRSKLAEMGRESELAGVRVFMETWAGQGYQGIPAETLAMMGKWVIKGNEKGYAVQSMCPDSGPLTDIEVNGVVSKVIEYYSDGQLGLRDSCYAMILAMTGRRPGQITSLKIKDLIEVDGKYYINFPRGKQRHSEWRSTFKRFQIVEDLWLLLQSQAQAVKVLFKERVMQPIPQPLLLELPLFPVISKYDGDEDLKPQLSGDFLHARSLEVAESLRKVKNVITIISERTGVPINLNPRRFRYTLGTNLAREGRGEYIIAEALDHSDTQNTSVYVKNIPEIVKHIDKAVALALAPLAQAFQGTLVTDETKARRGGDRSSRICSRKGNVGSCGSYGFCGALAPVACYTCCHFEPWLDGPHEFVLDQLISERDNVFASTGDLKIAAVNDRLILAVSDVVTRCNVLKRERAHV